MKKLLLLLIPALAISVSNYAGETINFDGDTIRYRGGTILKFDASTSITDEDAAWTISYAELSYLAGVTSDIQTQIAAKLASTNGTLQGVTLGGTTTNSGTITGGTIAGSITSTATITGGTFSGSTLSGSTTNSALTASLPIFTDANKISVSKSIANTLLALGIQSGKMTNAVDVVYRWTNTFSAAFSAAPVVTLTGATNDIPHLFSVTTTALYTALGPPTTRFSSLPSEPLKPI